jgi:hypothetical protein
MGEEEEAVKTSAKRKVVKLTPRRREAMELVKFIDAHGGRLGAFRGYGAAQRTPSGAPPSSVGK